MKKLYLNNRRKEVLHLCHERTWVSIYDIVALLISNIKYARNTMLFLKRQGLVKLVRCPIFEKTGPGLNYYALTRKGIGVIAPNRGKQYEAKMPTSVHLEHHHIINIMLTGFQVLSQLHTSLKVETLSEKSLQRDNEFYEYALKYCSSQIIIPDFVLCIGDDDEKMLFLGEVDTCTETLHSKKENARTIENKFKSVREYKNENIQNFFNKIFNYNFSHFSYLHITTGDENRIKKILKMCNDIEDVYICQDKQILPQIVKDKKGQVKLSYKNLISPVWYKSGTDNNSLHSILL